MSSPTPSGSSRRWRIVVTDDDNRAPAPSGGGTSGRTGGWRWVEEPLDAVAQFAAPLEEIARLSAQIVGVLAEQGARQLEP